MVSDEWRRDDELLEALLARGVVIPSPESTVVRDLDPTRIEPGAVINPGSVVCGRQTLLRSGARLGCAGGGHFEDVRAGRGVELFGGYFKDAVFLDGAVVRGHAEMRGGTLMEEESEAAHHVGYKMTITMPWVIAGSLINFCDALVAGGTSRRDHTELGSCMALYNFTPRGDKHGSMFGDVPRGVFLRSPRIFVGGQTQVVSPVKVGYGAVLVAGCGVRRDVPEGRLYGEAPRGVDRAFDPAMYGPLGRIFRLGVELVGNLWALDRWYELVRIPGADPVDQVLYGAARGQVRAGISERLKRLDRVVAKLPGSLDRHRVAVDGQTAPGSRPWHRERIAEHERVLATWPEVRRQLERAPAVGAAPGLDGVAASFAEARREAPGATYLSLVRGLDDDLVASGQADLQRIVDHVTGLASGLWRE